MIPALIEAALRAMLIAAAVWGCLRLLRMKDVVAQKATWSLVLAAAVAMPAVMHWHILLASISVRLPVASQQEAPAQAPVAALAERGGAGFDSAAPRRAEIPVHTLEPGDRFPAPAISHTEFSSMRPEIRKRSATVSASFLSDSKSRLLGAFVGWQRFLTLETVACFVYFAVLMALLARLTLGFSMALRIWLTAEPVTLAIPPDGEPVDRLRLRSSSAISSPITLGSGVLLPADYPSWDDEKLRIVLAHERSHVRQGDFYLQTLASLYAAVFWFSPLGWWLKRKLCDLGEAIGDRAGLEEAASRTSYAQVLLEFAAQPRPTALGVAMARTSNLSHRIERLLNEASFRQAFSGSRRRVLAAAVLVPIALFAATALIRVEAAQTPQTVTAPQPPTAPADMSAPAPAAPTAAPSPDAVPALDAAQAASVAPAAPTYGEVRDSADERAEENSASEIESNDEADAHEAAQAMKSDRRSSSHSHGYSYSYSSDGTSYALVTDPNQHITFSGDWDESTHATIDKARKLAHGKFLWFTHDGKSYFVEDPAIVSELETMQKPIEELGRQQEVLGEKQEALGRQQEELGRKQETASIPTPDISKEMARLNEALAKLNAKKGSTVTQEELAEVQGKLGDLQGRLGELEGEVGARQGEFGAQQGKLGEQQGRLGAEQGRLGAEQGRLATAADRKVKTIIEQSLHDGKAKPVE